MQYQEKKISKGYEYYGAGVFGEMEVVSTQKLDGDKLDGIMALLVKGKDRAQTVNGEIKISEDHTVTYKFTKNLQWGEEKILPPEPCEDTHTETNEQGKSSTQTSHAIAKICNWCRRFVEAFREAWRNSQSGRNE